MSHQHKPHKPPETARSGVKRRIEALERVAVVASGSLNSRAIGTALLDEALGVLGGDSGAVALLSDDRTTLTTLYCRGYSRETEQRFACYPIETALPTSDTARTGDALYVETVSECDTRYPHLAASKVDGCRGAFAALPLAIDDRVLGVVFLSFSADRRFRHHDRAFIETMVLICAQAMDRLRLYESAVREVRERRVAESALQRVQARNNAMIAATLDCIITIDEQERVVEWNPAAEQTFGYSRLDALSARLSELIVPENLGDVHLRGISHFLSTGEGTVLNKRSEMPAVRADGSMLWVEMAVVPINLGGSYLFTAHLRDITEEKRSLERQRAFFRDVILSASDGRLTLCFAKSDLPPPAPAPGKTIQLTRTRGLHELRHAVRDIATGIGFADERWYDLTTAVSEAGMNAILHAGGGRGRIGVRANTIQVHVEDHGKGIDIQSLPRAAFQRGFSTAGTLGHGIKIMLQMVDRIWLLTGPDGTTVVLEQDLVRPDTEP